jgi:hypothetical protein
MSDMWKTEFGLRRVKREPPTLEEAIVAAQGLTDDLKQQAEIAASLMGIPADDTVRKAVAKASAKPRATVSATGRGGMQRAVVVERKTVRRPAGVKRFG